MNRPAPTAEGTLARTPFGHVLLYIAERGLTGSLVVRADGQPSELAGENVFTFDTGALTQARLAQVTEPLGFVLRERGVITDEQMNESLTRLARGEGLQGEILCAMRACDAAAVNQALHVQVIRKAVRCFAAASAPYQYFEGVDLLAGFGASRPRVDVFTVLWRGTRAYPEPRVIDPVLARVGGQAVRLKPGAVDLQRFGFDAEERASAERLRGEALSLAQFARSASDTRARAMVYALLVTKQIDVVALPVARASVPKVAAPVPTAPVMSPAQATRLAEAQARLVAMEDETYYQMLGVPTEASIEGVRAAFLEQATRWHPDRVSSDTTGLREVHQRIFGYLTEAQEVLTDEASVGRYLALVQEGGGTPSSQRRMVAMIEAATDAQKAEVRLKRREYDEAEQLARRALAVSADDPNTLAVLAAVLLERRTDGPPPVEALALLTRAVLLAPKHDRGHLLLGSYYRRTGELAQAIEHFRRALEANPRNVDAEREVRVVEMRARNSSDNLRAAQPGRITDLLLSRFLKR